MKKSLIVLGILAGITGIAHAENKTVLSGSLGYSVGVNGYIDTKDSIGSNAKAAAKGFGDNDWDLKTSTAKFGISGNEDINDSLSAIYKFEFKVNKELFNDEQVAKNPQLAKFNSGVNETSKAYLGLKGGFGEVTFGKQSGGFGDAVGFNDNFQEAGSVKKHKLGDFNKGIKYKTPGSLYGFEFTTVAELDGNDPATKGVDFWETSAVYDANGVFAGVGYQNRLRDKNGTNGSEEVMGTSIGYHNDAFKAGVGYTHTASHGDSYNVGGEVYTGPNTFRAEVNYEDPKGKDNNWLDASLGYQYNFSKRTYSWVEGKYSHPEVGDVDGYEVVVGVRHDF